MADIPTPQLEMRDVAEFAAQLIASVSGHLTTGRIDTDLQVLLRLRPLVEAGLQQPVTPQLTRANPFDPHVRIITTFAIGIAALAWRQNKVPEKNLIAFINRILPGGMRDAVRATTTLQFTLTASAGEEVIIPSGTLASTQDGVFTVTTDEEVIVAPGEAETVAATRTVAGKTLLSPNQITRLDGFEGVTVTNTEIVDSGAEAETVDEALVRARNYIVRGERWVTAGDAEEGILEGVLYGDGIVRAFDLVKYPEWGVRTPGYTTIVVMTLAGNPVSTEIRARIQARLKQRVGHIISTLIDPVYRPFNITASIKVTGITSSGKVKSEVERALRAYYAPSVQNFGLRVSRSEIIQRIEDTPGVDRIATDADGPILDEPLADIDLAGYELPQLGEVDLTVVL